MFSQNKQNEKMLSRKEAAEMLGVAPATLEVWACTGRYALPYVKVGRLVRYKYQDLLDFIERRRVDQGGVHA